MDLNDKCLADMWGEHARLMVLSAEMFAAGDCPAADVYLHAARTLFRHHLGCAYRLSAHIREMLNAPHVPQPGLLHRGPY